MTFKGHSRSSEMSQFDRGATENARTENWAPSKMQGWKTLDWKTRHQCVGGGKCGTECYGTPLNSRISAR